MSKELRPALPSFPLAPAAVQPHRELLRSFESLIENETLTRAVLIAGIERKSDGVILLGHDGSVRFLNDTARATLEEADGFAYADGEFTTARLPETRRLQACIRKLSDAALNGSARACTRMLVTRPSGRAPYVVSVAAPPEAAGGGCVLHIVDLAAQATLSKEAACETFGLSDREADLAVELTRCLNLRDAAAQAGMALNTARNHMHSIFTKCGVHSQVELSRILMRLV